MLFGIYSFIVRSIAPTIGERFFACHLQYHIFVITLEEKNYTKREGSTIITLNRDFVATLSVGEHTLAIASQHGTATAKFTVKAKPAETLQLPQTGDTTPLMLWVVLLVISAMGLAGCLWVRFRKKHYGTTA